MTELFPGLHRAASICTALALECDAKVEAKPHSPFNARRRAESRTLRRAASRITDAMLDEPLAATERPFTRYRRVADGESDWPNDGSPTPCTSIQHYGINLTPKREDAA